MPTLTKLPLMDKENTKHCVRNGHSTTTVLHRIQEQMSRGLSEKRPCDRSVLLTLDLSKAFDTVSHAKTILATHVNANRHQKMDFQLQTRPLQLRRVPKCSITTALNETICLSSQCYVFMAV